MIFLAYSISNFTCFIQLLMNYARTMGYFGITCGSKHCVTSRGNLKALHQVLNMFVIKIRVYNR